MLGSCAAVYCCWLETILSKAVLSDLAIYNISGFICVN